MSAFPAILQLWLWSDPWLLLGYAAIEFATLVAAVCFAILSRPPYP